MTPNSDFFNARYFSAAAGSFLRPDPANAGASLANPQSWNGYAYALGNPLAFVDPSGMSGEYSGFQNNYYCPPSQATCPTGPPTFSSGPGVPTDLEDQYQIYAGGMLQTLAATVALSFAEDRGGHDLDDLSADLSALFGLGVSLFSQTEDNGEPNFIAVADAADPLGIPKNLYPTTPQMFWAPFREGFNAATNSLKKKSCGAFFHGQGASQMEKTTYSVGHGDDPSIGARTYSPTQVVLFQIGPFFSPFAGARQYPNINGTMNYLQVRSTLLLHELGHQLAPLTGFQPDSSSSAFNAAQTNTVRNACP